MRARVRGLLGGRWSLRRRVARLAFVGVLVLAAQLVAQVISGRAAQEGGFQAFRIGAVQEELVHLATSMDAQRSSVLLYRSTGLPSYASTYEAERANATRLLARLGQGVTTARQGASVRDIESAIAAWEAWSGAQMAGTGPLGPADLVTGETRYQAVLAAQHVLANELTADWDAALGSAQQNGITAFVTSIAGSLAAAVILVVLAIRIIQLGVTPVIRLASTARHIALGAPVSIEVVAEQAPIGIVRLDVEGRIVRVNRALELIHRLPADRLEGRTMYEVVHPADRARVQDVVRELERGPRTSMAFEARALRGDGTAVWCSVTAGRLLSANRQPVGTIGVLEDISERKLQAERAARIQRELWPARPPALDGYDVAGACLPAQEVAGDLYDWALADDGQLELTVADVMGKGIGAALVAAMLRTALRAAPSGLGPAAKLSLASSSMTLGRGDDETFATVFHARLDPRTGLLRYVDAGHGYCHVLRRNGPSPGGGRHPGGVQRRPGRAAGCAGRQLGGGRHPDRRRPGRHRPPAPPPDAGPTGGRRDGAGDAKDGEGTGQRRRLTGGRQLSAFCLPPDVSLPAMDGDTARRADPAEGRRLACLTKMAGRGHHGRTCQRSAGRYGRRWAMEVGW
ncbi:MAG: PAS domain S-box protein [Chloroflexi bacterium]|nr:MAG: PAS domain S-box protein [Chloroflexota bacterium]